MRLVAWHRWLLLGALSGVALSGLLWFVLHDVMDIEPGVVLHAMLVVHGVTAYASAIGFGSLLPQHVLIGLQQPRNRVTGLIAVMLMVALIGSALLLYYGAEETRALARLLHLAAGLSAVLVLGLHVFLAWRRPGHAIATRQPTTPCQRSETGPRR